jgi:hypothetical protein
MEKAEESSASERLRVCYLCGRVASWRISIAVAAQQRRRDSRGDERKTPETEEDACDMHARGHIRLRPIVVSPAR